MPLTGTVFTCSGLTDAEPHPHRERTSTKPTCRAIAHITTLPLRFLSTGRQDAPFVLTKQDERSTSDHSIFTLVGLVLAHDLPIGHGTHATPSQRIDAVTGETDAAIAQHNVGTASVETPYGGVQAIHPHRAGTVP